MKRVAFWNRMSHQNSVERESHINHRTRAEEFCRFHGYELVKEYTLLDVQGSKIRQTREYYEYRADVRDKKIDALLVTGIKRFARKVKILVEEIQFLSDNKVDFISMGESIDTTSPYGKFFFHLISALSELESDEVSQRIRHSIKPRAERGLPLGGAAPLGYKWEIIDGNKKLVVDHESADVVKQAFRQFISTRQLRETCRNLTAMGLMARKSQMTTTTLKRILTTTAYIGKHLRNYKGVSKEGKFYDKPEEDHIYNECESIIDETTWNMARSLLKTIKSNQPSKLKRNTYLLSGVLKCHCGGKCYGTTYKDEKWSKYVCKNCNSRTHLNKVDSAVLSVVNDIVLRTDFLEARVKEQGGQEAMQYFNKARTLRSLLSRASSSDQSLILKTLIKSIDVEDENLNIHFRLMPKMMDTDTLYRNHKDSDKSIGVSLDIPTIQLFAGNPADNIEFSYKVSLKDPPLPENTLAERIKKARLSMGLHQEEVDRRAKLSRGYVGMYERAIFVPKKDKLSRLAKVLKVPVQYLEKGEHG